MSINLNSMPNLEGSAWIAASTVATIIAALMLLWLSKRPAVNLKHLPHAARDNILIGSWRRFFGCGMSSLQLVFQQSSSLGFKPWVVPGGLLTSSWVVVSSPASARQVLTRNVNKGYAAMNLYYPGTPKTVVSSEGEDWKRRRHALNPSFTHSSLRQVVGVISKIAIEAMSFIEAELDKGEKVINLSSLAARFALDVVGAAVYGASFGAVLDPISPAHVAAHQLSMMSAKNFTNPLRRLLRIGKSDFENYNRVFDSLSERHIQQHPNAPESAGLLHVLLNATDAEGQKVWGDKRELMEEVRLVLNAAHDPALPIAFALMELARYPKILQRAAEEIDSVLKGRTDLEFADLNKLPYIDAIFRETLRLYPVSGIGSGRKLENDLECDGVVLPKGSFVIVPFFTVLRSPLEWEDPNTWNPDRFMGSEPEVEARRNKMMIVFSSGPRMCVGFQLALYEGAVFLAHLIRRYRVQPLDDKELELDCGVHIMPKLIELKVQRRN